MIDNPKSVVTLATQKFLSEKPDGQLTLQTAQWSDAIPQLVQEKILQTFENVHYRFVSLPSDAVNADYHLLLNIRRFQIVEGNNLTAEVELDAQLMDHDGKIVGAQAHRPQSARDGVGRKPGRASDDAGLRRSGR